MISSYMHYLLPVLLLDQREEQLQEVATCLGTSLAWHHMLCAIGHYRQVFLGTCLTPVSQLFSICPIMQAASGHTPTAGSQTVIMQCLTPKVSYMSYNSLMVLSVSA